MTLCFGIAPAQARVVGILFDDSGSMKNKIQLPAFAAQLLVGTLDGRAGRDRLVTARMSQASELRVVEQPDIGTLENQRGLIRTIAKTWPNPKGGTPYTQVLVLLREIQALQREGEEAFLIVLTDGGFEPEPDAVLARREFERVRDSLRGALFVDFVVIGAALPSTIDQSRSVGAVVEAQGIRAALLETFNGAPDLGRHDIDDAPALNDAIRDIVARSVSTNRAGLERYLTRQPGMIAITSPLSIHRIVTVATAESGAAVEQPLGSALGAVETYGFDAEMLGSDSGRAWANARLRGQATHMRFEPALAPGTHKLAFSGDTQGTLVLVETGASLELAFFDPNGSRITPGPDGVVTLAAGAQVRVGLEIYDSINGTRTLVPVRAFADPPKATLADNTGSRTASIAPDPAASDRIEAQFPTDAERAGRVTAGLSVQGIDLVAPPLAYRVIRAASEIGLRLIPSQGCAGCDGKTVDVPLAPGQSPGMVAAIEITLDAPINGGAVVSLGGSELFSLSPDGLTRDMNIAIPAGSKTVQTLPVYLVKSAAEVLDLGARMQEVTLRARTVAPLTGETAATGVMQFQTPPATLTSAGHSGDPSGATALQVNLDTLAQGTDATFFILDGVIGDPKRGTIEVEELSFLTFAITAEANKIRVVPQVSTICACLLYFDQGPATIAVTWRDPTGLQTARAEGRIDLSVPLVWQAVFACGKLLMILAGMLYVLRGLFVAFRTRVFPNGSGVDIEDRGSDPRFQQFSSGVSTRVLAFLWPFGNRDQQIAVAGLILQATRGGAMVMLKGSNPAYSFEYIGQKISEMLEMNPRQRGYRMSWDETATINLGGKRTVRLLRSATDRRLRRSGMR